jgi:2-dehydro-3-deoxygluconokinase
MNGVPPTVLAEPYDVVVLGEALVEISSQGGFRTADDVRVSFSGDALNGAAAAARTGARVALLSRIGDDDLGDGVVDTCRDHGVGTALLQRVARPNGTYFVVADPDGGREFTYLRAGSAASTLDVADVEIAAVRSARALLVSGIAATLSPSTTAAVDRATAIVADAGNLVVYDPNFRPKLTTPEAARAMLATVAPRAALVTPSCPGDSLPLLGTDDPVDVARACLGLGAAAVAVTMGANGVLFDDGLRCVLLPPFPARRIVDATGAGDVLAGVATARIVQGQDVVEAVRDGMAAATISVAHRGGTGHVPTMAEIAALRSEHASTPAGREAS